MVEDAKYYGYRKIVDANSKICKIVNLIIMRIKTLFTVLIIIITLQTSCKNNSNKLEKESILIVNLLYNKEAKKFPVPPPPEKGMDIPKQQENITDKFIYKKKYALAIGNISNENEEIINLPETYKTILRNPSKTFFCKSLYNIKFEDLEGNLIPVLNYRKGSKIQTISKENQVIGLLFVSDIKFNKSLTKAILTFGSYTHELAGYTSIIGLNKKDGIWEINFSKNVSES